MIGVGLLIARILRAIGAFCFVVGGLALVVATATQLISGTPAEGYPAFSGQSGYGTYLWQIGLFTLAGAVVGFPAWYAIEALTYREPEDQMTLEEFHEMIAKAGTEDEEF